MGWVTLTLRKKELKVEHAYYQLRDLQISREKRAMARGKQANSTQLNNDKKAQLAAAKEQYDANKASVIGNDTSTEGTTETQGQTQGETQGETQAEGSKSSSSYDLSSGQQLELNNFREDYETLKESINSEYDDEMAMLEEEAADAEAELDVEQVDVESQMEAISEEMSAVSDAISSEIQNSTIKLS